MKWKIYSAYSAFFAISVISAFFTSTNQAIPLYSCYASLFLLYFFIIQQVKAGDDLKPAVALGLIVRCALLFAIPNLSADYWRWIWDGKFQAIGYSPYALTPKELMDRSLNTFLNAGNIFHHLPDVRTYTTNGPLIQFINYTAVKLSMNHDRL